MRRLDNIHSVTLAIGPILDSLPFGVAIYSAGLDVIAANSKASAILDTNHPMDKSLASTTEGLTAVQWTDYLTSVLATGQPLRLENVSFHTDRGIRFLHVLLTPLMDGAEQTGVVVFQDVTDIIRLARELEIAERSAALGKLSSKVAHELNGPIDGAMRYISLALRQIDMHAPDMAKDYLQRAREGLHRMAQIVGEILEYSRGMPIPLETCPLGQMVQEAVGAAEARWTGPVIEVRQSYGSDIPLIRRGNLYQVFCNIVKNAYDAMPSGGRLEIVGSVTEDHALVMTFRDTGPGLSPQDMDKVFEPFFTTKVHGTGLGLAVCKDLVQRNKGWIDVQNAVEGGAIVTIRLPLAEII